MKQRRLLFAPYSVPPTPCCGDCSWKAFTEEPESKRETRLEKKQERNREGGKDLGWRRREETLLYGVQRFFVCVSWRIMGLQGWGVGGSTVPPLKVCLPVRVGLWVPVTGSLCWLCGADGACEWMTWRGVMFYKWDFLLWEGGVIRCPTENEWTQKVPSVLIESVCDGREKGGLFERDNPEGAPCLPGGGTTASCPKREELFCLVQLLHVQCITWPVSEHTCYKAHFVVHCLSIVS